MAAGDERVTSFAELLRPDDLLYLRISGSNLRLRKDGDDGAYLEVKNAKQPAYLHFNFQPQTIAEGAFFEAAIVPGGTTPIQGESNRPDSEANATYHEPFSTPGSPSQSAINTAAAHKPQTIPTAAQIGHASRLVFAVEPGTKIPFTVEGLLDWSKLTLNVNGIAAIGDDASAQQIANAPAIREPAPNETSIELPYRLVISPTRAVAWLHRDQAFTSRGRTEMWHTQLALRQGDEITRLTKTNLAPLRAIWSPDYSARAMPEVAHDPYLGRTAMNANDRHQIVVLTSAFHGYEVERKFRPFGIVADRIARNQRINIPRWVPFVPQPFYADRLMLSALGGYLRSRGQWDPPRPAQRPSGALANVGDILKNIRIGDIIHPAAAENFAVARENVAANQLILQIPRDTTPLDLSEWVHLATQGRDHYVRIVYEGELWPFRHPAALVKVTERKFEENAGIVGAYLMQRMFIVVRKPVVTSAHDDFGNPLKDVRLTTLVTPDIADPDAERIAGTKRSFWVKVMVGPNPTDRALFPFHGVAHDIEGGEIDFNIPMMFVSRMDLGSETTKPTIPITAYNAKAVAPLRAANVPGQKVAFAPHDPAKPTDTTQLVTQSLNFVMDPSSVQPRLLKADVKIPQVQQLIGTNDPTTIRLSPDFVSNGFADAANTTGVFAEMVKNTYDSLDSTDLHGALPVNINAEKAGGIATPNLAVTSLSRALGPLAGKVEDARTNTFDPAQFFPKGSAMLFGSFDLADLFLPKPSEPPAMSLDENAPKMRTEKDNTPGKSAIVTTLDWEPKFLEPSKKLDLGIAAIEKDRDGVKSTLRIKGEIRQPIDPGLPGAPPAGDPTFAFSGELNAFTVSVLGSVFINFDRFSFNQRAGAKPDTKVDLDTTTPLEFKGDLAFIEEMRKAIPPGLFGDGPSLELLPAPPGIRAGFAFALPPLTVGVFTLKDVKLSAALTLPFIDGKPVFDFNISERPHPFLLAVSIFGGGGFFHLQLDTAGMKALEVALEFGATAAIDLGVASGEVHIMAGIYFSLQRKEGSTDLAAILTGYLRMGGSLSVLGLIKVSVEFNLSFTYDSVRDKAYGRATLTVSVEVLFFSTSVELTVERAFGGSGDPHFLDFFPEPEPWEEYALAFAA